MSGMQCPSCGHVNPEGANFCSSCGTRMVEETDVSTATFQHDVVVPVTTTGEHPAVSISRDEIEGAVLIVHRGPNAGSRYALDRDVTTAGRHPDSDIFLDDITVSRRHAEVIRNPEGYVLRDVGSLNGTYVRGERIDAEVDLHDGDEVQIGRYKLVFFEEAQ